MFISSWRGRVFLSKRSVFIFAVILFLSAAVFSQTPVPAVSNSMQISAQAAPAILRLEDLEQMALKSNPTLAQAEAAIRVAEGRRVQAGLLPNPIIGYAGEKFTTRAFDQRSEHSGYVEQEFPLGGKLRKSRAIFAQEKLQTEYDAAAQKQRVLNAVRSLYYEALGAQALVEVRGELAKLAQVAVKTTAELFNVGQADRPDVLQIEVEAQKAQLDLLTAENERDQLWQRIAALVGDPKLKPTPLAGNLERNLPSLDREVMLAKIISESPEIKSVMTGIEKAQASLIRAKAERAPDLLVKAGFGYSNETLELRNQTIAQPPTAAGPQGFASVGLRIPIFNRNQGGIAAATAEIEIAEREQQRLELELRAEMATTFQHYNTALNTAQQY